MSESSRLLNTRELQDASAFQEARERLLDEDTRFDAYLKFTESEGLSAATHNLGSLASTVRTMLQSIRYRLDEAENSWIRRGSIGGTLKSIHKELDVCKRLNNILSETQPKARLRTDREPTSHDPQGQKSETLQRPKSREWQTLGKEKSLAQKNHAAQEIQKRADLASNLKTTTPEQGMKDAKAILKSTVEHLGIDHPDALTILSTLAPLMKHVPSQSNNLYSVWLELLSQAAEERRRATEEDPVPAVPKRPPKTTEKTRDGYPARKISPGAALVSNPGQSSGLNPDKAFPTIQSLHALSVKGLEILANMAISQDEDGIASRLRVWGLGIFAGELALDEIFRPERETDVPSLDVGYRILSSSFLRILVNIEYIFLLLEIDTPPVLAFLNDVAAVFDIPTIQEQLQPLFALLPEIYAKEGILNRAIDRLKVISDEVQLLYELSEPIIIMRDICCSRDPRPKSAQPIEIPDTMPDEKTNSEVETSLSYPEEPEPLTGSVPTLVDDIIGLAQEITALLRQAEGKHALDKGESIQPTLSVLLEKENERLRDWRHKISKDVEEKDHSGILMSLKRLLTGLKRDIITPSNGLKEMYAGSLSNEAVKSMVEVFRGSVSRTMDIYWQLDSTNFDGEGRPRRYG